MARIGMNLGLFFEGTGRGVAGKITNVTWLRDRMVVSESFLDSTRRMFVVERMDEWWMGQDKDGWSADEGMGIKCRDLREPQRRGEFSALSTPHRFLRAAGAAYLW